MLEIRQELSKTSTKKYDAMAAAMGEDERVRGLLQYYGANRTRKICWKISSNSKSTTKSFANA